MDLPEHLLNTDKVKGRATSPMFSLCRYTLQSPFLPMKMMISTNAFEFETDNISNA